MFRCFFINNQYRILYEANGVGSANLEDIFQKRLRRVGQMVAILDAWQQPAYLTRRRASFVFFCGPRSATLPILTMSVCNKPRLTNMVNVVQFSQSSCLLSCFSFGDFVVEFCHSNRSQHCPTAWEFYTSTLALGGFVPSRHSVFLLSVSIIGSWQFRSVDDLRAVPSDQSYGPGIHGFAGRSRSIASGADDAR